MKKLIALAALAAAPLAAQNFEVGLNISRQTYAEPSFVASGVGMNYQMDSKTIVAARFGYALVDMGPALFQISAAFQPQATTTGTLSSGGTTLASDEYKTGYWGAGLAFNFKALVAVGVGLDYRSEKLESGAYSTTYGRPWARANIGYAFPMPIVKPFIGLEVALPLAKKDPGDVSSIEDRLKTTAPKSQIGVYGGIRF